MKPNNEADKPANNDKHSGGWHIFLFLGLTLVALVLLKFLLSYLNIG